MFQQLILTGNLGRDPDLRYTPAGVAVCDFSLATNKKWKDRETEEQREKVTWFRVTCWRGLAEAVNSCCEKGKLVQVIGEVDVSAWLGDDGEPRGTLEVTAHRVLFLGRSGTTQHENPAPPEDVGDIPF